MEQANRANASRPLPLPGQASSSTARPANPGRRRGLSKAALGRAKLGAIALSVVAFVGSLTAVVQASPAAIARMDAAAQQAPSAPVAPVPRLSAEAENAGVAPLVLPQRPQMPAIRPMVRSRGS